MCIRDRVYAWRESSRGRKKQARICEYQVEWDGLACKHFCTDWRCRGSGVRLCAKVSPSIAWDRQHIGCKSQNLSVVTDSNNGNFTNCPEGAKSNKQWRSHCFNHYKFVSPVGAQSIFENWFDLHSHCLRPFRALSIGYYRLMGFHPH